MENTTKIELVEVAGVQLKGVKVADNKIENYAEGLRAIGKGSRQLGSMTGVYVDDLLNHGFFDVNDRKTVEKFILEQCEETKVLRNTGSKMDGKPWTLSAARTEEICPWHDLALGTYSTLKCWADRLRKMAEPAKDESGKTEETTEETTETEAPATPADALAMIQNALKILGSDTEGRYKDEVLKIGSILPALQAKINAQ